MSSDESMPIGDLEWDEKPGRPQVPTRVYTVSPLRPRDATRQERQFLTETERARQADILRSHQRATRRKAAA